MKIDLLNRMIGPKLEAMHDFHPVRRSNPTFIPIHLTGGIGDVIISIDAIRELKRQHQVVVYTAHKEAFQYFYKEPISVHESIHEFTWKIDFNTLAKFFFYDGFYGFMTEDHETLFNNQENAYLNNPDMERFLKTHSDEYYAMAIYGKKNGVSRQQFPMHSLGIEQKLSFQTACRKPSKNYITIHDGYDAQNFSSVAGRSTKQWSWKHWNNLIRMIRKHYPDTKIIQLGTKTAREIDGVDECLIEKTTITQAFDIISESRLHIDGDSGLVHAATRMEVPCVVIFGSTPDHFFGYPQNANIRSSVCEQACYWVTKDWMARCAIGHPRPLCMDETTAEQVMARVQGFLQGDKWVQP